MTTYDNLPLKLKSNKRMCCWQYELKNGDETKVPYNPVTRRRAKSNDPTTYSDFASAVAAVGNFDGIGFFVGDEVSAIDLDDCFNEDGSLKLVAQDVVNNFKGSYMERSPSKKGLRIIFLTPGFTYDKIKFYINNQKIGMEIYEAGASNQYVTLTGYVYRDGDVIDQTTALKIVQEKYMIRPKPIQKTSATPSGQSYLTDESVIEKAGNSVHGEKFKALWQGDIAGYASHSEADLALSSILSFFCSGDTAQVDRLFRKSGLYRDKWDRPQSGSTYGALTIQKALSNMTAFYEPGGKRSQAKDDFLSSTFTIADVHPEKNDSYSRRYIELVSRYQAAKNRLNGNEFKRKNLAGQREKLTEYIELLKDCELLTGFKQGLWNSVVESVTVRSNNEFNFIFRDGSTCSISHSVA